MARTSLSDRLKAASSAERIDPKKVAVYIRWSTEDQGDGTTLEVQRRNCEMYVQSQNWDINPDLVFIDEGHSGGSIDRPAMNALRETVKKGRVDCVVVYKLDRLSRNVLDTVNLVLDEWEGRCHLKSATQPLDTRDPLGKQFFYMLVGFAEYERQVIKERTFSGKVERATQGKNPGQIPPYGFRKGPVPGSFQIIPEEIELVRRLFRESLAGVGTAAMARKLNEEGIPYHNHRTGETSDWKSGTIKYMLKNPLYTGQLVYGQSKGQSRKRPGEPQRTRSEAPLVSVQAEVYDASGERLNTPPVDVMEFEESRRRAEGRASRRTSNRAWVSDHLLTGMVRCGKCGGAMFGRKRQVTPTGGTYSPAYYLCYNSTGKFGGTCDNGYVRQDSLDELVVDYVKNRYGNAVGRQQVMDAIHSETAGKIRVVEVSLAEVRKSLAGHDQRLSELREEYVHRRLTLEEYRDLKNHVDGQTTEERERADRLLRELEQLHSATAASHDLERLATTLDTWDALTTEQQKTLLSEFLVKVTVYRPKNVQVPQVEIFWRKGTEELKEALSV